MLVSTFRFIKSFQPSKSSIGLYSKRFSTSIPIEPLSIPPTIEIVNELSKLDIKVGLIQEIEVHPEANTLFIEKIDCGDEFGPRTIVSGLVPYCTKEYLLNKKVIVVANLKPRSLKGITSHGMILCSSNNDHTQVEPLITPDNCDIGERVKFQGIRNEHCEAGNRASKAFKEVIDDLFVTDEGVAVYKGIPFTTPSGGLITSSIKRGKIS